MCWLCKLWSLKALNARILTFLGSEKKQNHNIAPSKGKYLQWLLIATKVKSTISFILTTGNILVAFIRGKIYKYVFINGLIHCYLLYIGAESWFWVKNYFLSYYSVKDKERCFFYSNEMDGLKDKEINVRLIKTEFYHYVCTHFSIWQLWLLHC